MKKIKFSVVVPIYNVANYLDRCVLSIVNQTYSNIEIILVDDGSPDNCPGMCDKWKKKDSRIVVIHKDNGGLSSARNAGLDIASGDFISFIDSDDYIDLDLYEKLAEIIDIEEPDLLSFGLHEVDLDGNIKKLNLNSSGVVSADKALKHLLLCDGKMQSFACNKIFHRKILGDLRFLEELKYGEDTPFVYELLKGCSKYYEYNECKYKYMRREDSLIGGSFQKRHILSVIAAEMVANDCYRYHPKFKDLAQCHLFIRAFCLLKSMLQSNKEDVFVDEYNKLLYIIHKTPSKKVYNYYSKKIFFQTVLIKINYKLYARIIKQ